DAPLRMMMAVSSDPAESIVRSKPFAIDSTAAKTSTTAATPMTATREAPRRCGRFRMLSQLTATICLMLRMMLSPGQRVDDRETHGLERREDSGNDPGGHHQ